MRWDRRLWIRLAALSGLVSVAAGAFAAHGMPDPGAKEVMRTGANYEAIHALGTLVCAVIPATASRRVGWVAALFLGGSVLFSGSLYALALGAPSWVGPITPLGGLMFLGGWAILFLAAGDVSQTRAAD